MFHLIYSKYVSVVVLTGMLLGFGFFLCTAFTMNMSTMGGMSGVDMQMDSTLPCAPVSMELCFLSSTLTQMIHWQDAMILSVLGALILTTLVFTGYFLLPHKANLLAHQRLLTNARIYHSRIFRPIIELFSQGILHSRIFA